MNKVTGIDIGALLDKLDNLAATEDSVMSCTAFNMMVNKEITDHLDEHEKGHDKGDISQLYSVLLDLMKLAKKGGHLGYEYGVISDQFITVLTARLERYQHLSRQAY